MELWLWAVVGGLAGTVLMDLTAIAAEKLNITSGGRCGGPQVIGRWVFGIFDARFVHKNIIDSSPVKNEASAGWIFHYLTGGSLALTYPLFCLAPNKPMPQDHLISSVARAWIDCLRSQTRLLHWDAKATCKCPQLERDAE